MPKPASPNHNHKGESLCLTPLMEKNGFAMMPTPRRATTRHAPTSPTTGYLRGPDQKWEGGLECTRAATTP
eukprot:8479761-Prorocentrum_lima.AAC.1